MAAQPVIQCDSLTKRFGNVVAVQELNFELEPGTIVGFIGPNGAGKSTTIRMMVGLSAPSSGTVRIYGKDPLHARAARARVGYVPGELRLDERLSVAATLESWASLRGGVNNSFKHSLMDRLELQADSQVRGLSTGNRRKLALVGALMPRPELLILDEPTSGLDPLIQAEVMLVLEEMAADGVSVLLSSHVLSEVERVADRIVVIKSGVVVAEGSTDELRRGAAQQYSAVFTRSAPNQERFESLPGVQSLHWVHPGELQIEWVGPPGPLLKELSRYELESLTAPEPDLETAFMSYYRDGHQGAAQAVLGEGTRR